MPQALDLHNTLTHGLIHGHRIAVVALGANIPSAFGEPLHTVAAALSRLAEGNVAVLGTSRLWRTPCVPAGAGPDYVNAVAILSTDLTPEAFLGWLHEIEVEFDRARTGRWASRTLDLDLIDHGGAILPDEQTQQTWRDLPFSRQTQEAPDGLILPHPRLQDRGFVLLPLQEAAPQWRDPVTGASVSALIEALPDDARTGMTPDTDRPARPYIAA